MIRSLLEEFRESRNRPAPETAPDPPETHHLHWMGRMCTTSVGTLDELQPRVPSYLRRPFQLAAGTRARSRAHPELDIIIRCPTAEDGCYVPIGIVSKSYRLLQHQELLELVCRAVKENGRDPATAEASLTLTSLGERMRIVVQLAESIRPPDGQPMQLQLECHNSVDGSQRFSAMMSWYRQVCGNGLMMRMDRVRVRRRHDNRLDPRMLGDVLCEGLKCVNVEASRYKRWSGIKPSPEQLDAWIDGEVRRTWGPLAAARTKLILETGWDGTFESPFERQPPSRKCMIRKTRVPGVFPPSRDLFAIAQALAWIAKERRDLQEQFE